MRSLSSWIMIFLITALAPRACAAEDDASSHPSLPLLPLMGKAAITFRSPSILEQIAATYTTPERIAGFLQKRFTFVRDETLFGTADYWQAPEELVARRKGDCEDYALLARDLLQRNGIKAYVFSLFGQGGYAHTVSVFMDRSGRYNVMNQDKLHYYHASSLESLASLLYTRWSVGGITDRYGTRGRMIFRISNQIKD